MCLSTFAIWRKSRPGGAFPFIFVIHDQKGWSQGLVSGHAVEAHCRRPTNLWTSSAEWATPPSILARRESKRFSLSCGTNTLISLMWMTKPNHFITGPSSIFFLVQSQTVYWSNSLERKAYLDAETVNGVSHYTAQKPKVKKVKSEQNYCSWETVLVR